MRKTICLAVFIFMTFFGVSAQPAPDFTLKDLNGDDISLSSLKGKIILIDFWAIWCKTCKEAFGRLNEIQKEFGEKGVVVVGVSYDKAKPQKVEAFAKKAGITYKVLLDPGTQTAKLYTIKGVPSLVVVGREMQIVKIFRGMNKSTEKEISELLKKLSEE